MLNPMKTLIRFCVQQVKKVRVARDTSFNCTTSKHESVESALFSNSISKIMKLKNHTEHSSLIFMLLLLHVSSMHFIFCRRKQRYVKIRTIRNVLMLSRQASETWCLFAQRSNYDLKLIHLFLFLIQNPNLHRESNHFPKRTTIASAPTLHFQ